MPQHVEPSRIHGGSSGPTYSQDLLDQLDEMEEDIKRLRESEKEVSARNEELEERRVRAGNFADVSHIGSRPTNTLPPTNAPLVHANKFA